MQQKNPKKKDPAAIENKMWCQVGTCQRVGLKRPVLAVGVRRNVYLHMSTFWLPGHVH